MTKFESLKRRLVLIKDLVSIKISLIIVRHWLEVPPSLYLELVKHTVSRFERIALTRGLLAAVKEMKNSRLVFTRWLCGRPIKGDVGCPIWKGQLLPKMIPKRVMSELIRTKDIKLIKAILTVLSVSRYFKGGTPLDTDNITRGADPILPKSSELILALRRLGITPGLDRPTKGNFEWVVSAGPNGPSISSALQDLPKFLQLFSFQVLIMRPDLLSKLTLLHTWIVYLKLPTLLGLSSFRDDSLRKISVKDDRECKSRPFAIFDYWSQMTLKPLHDELYRLLRLIPQDCTYNQNEGIKKMQEYQSTKNFYSYDLTAATDRFPVSLQVAVMSLMYGSDYAKAWQEIMTREPFRLKGVERPIRWATGQPLGAKSSWAMFTLCHHVVVQLAAIRTNSDAQYVVLGDDIVLLGRPLATEYKRIMSQLGVDISPSKSHVSKDTFEFAKRWSHKSQDVSGFPIVGFIETLSKPLELAALLALEAPSRGYLKHVCPRSLSLVLSPLGDLAMIQPFRLAVWTADRTCWYYAFLSWLHTGHSGWAKYIVQTAGYVRNPYTSHELLSEVVRNKWLELINEGLMKLMMFASGLYSTIPVEITDWNDTSSSEVPVWFAHGTEIQFSETLKTIPIFEALEDEHHMRYEKYLQDRLSDDKVKALSLRELEELKLPPKPQLKGFEPIRPKENVRALSLLSQGLNREIRTLITD
uniref:RNA-dependent RNA polymerase n=1 Tax=Diaporthe gulyae mitovirus 4 TaxID=3077428 RepID=A0AA96H9T8_9VIRU|nr:MAG: RNA-dependent RNA polymerase [Diaporthe gulyae mitovirus 4]